LNLEMAHETLVRNDETIRDLEYKHLSTRHQQSDDLLRRQHQVELVNQREYMKHAEQEMKQRHLGESRQLPKNLKVMCSYHTAMLTGFSGLLQYFANHIVTSLTKNNDL
jgi:hypothetical protein